MSTACIAAIDQGTSSSRVLLISSSGRVLSSHQLEHTQHYPTSGQVEHDPLEIWKNVKICLSEALRKSSIELRVVAVGITNQRETTIVWDKDNGAPYHNAIVWNDTRTAKICERLIERFGSKDYFREKTGLPIASYFSASKLIYLLESVPGLRQQAEQGNALFGTMDSWLLWKLTNGAVHGTDVSNAARTLLMNLRKLDWDEEILAQLSIPRAMLPSIHPSSYTFGQVDTSLQEQLTEHEVDAGLVERFSALHNVPLSGVLGDQNAALFGQACFYPGDAKCTYGTGAFLLMNTGQDIVPSTHGLLTTVAYQLSNHVDPVNTDSHPKRKIDSDMMHGKAVYALEGSVAYSGSVIQWLRDNLGLIKSAAETEVLAASVPDNGGVYFVPAFAGLYAPYWREDARGVIIGLTAYNTRAHLVRAGLEASAFQTIELLQAMQADTANMISPMCTKALRVDGGLTNNALIMQFQSDVLNLPLVKPKIAETTALGAAFVAGLGVGLWKNLDELKACWHAEQQWRSKISAQERGRLVCWHAIVQYGGSCLC
jgi:glycerol kinase